MPRRLPVEQRDCSRHDLALKPDHGSASLDNLGKGWPLASRRLAAAVPFRKRNDASSADGSVYNRATPLALATGTRIGPYEVVARIGAGGMGEVYRARDTRLGATSRSRCCPDASPATPTGRRASRAKRRRWPRSIIPISPRSTASKIRRRLRIAMELVEGEELAARIARGPFPLDEATAIATEIAEALEAAHELSESSTAISSPPTSASGPTARSRCSTSAWQRPSRRGRPAALDRLRRRCRALP